MGKAMFSPDVVGTDSFLDLPDESQLLYFRLGFEGTYGKIQGVKRIARGYGCGAEALQTLYDEGYLFDYEGACWVRHYWVNNTFKMPNSKYALTMSEITKGQILSRGKGETEPKEYGSAHGEIGFEDEPFKSAFRYPNVSKASISLTQGSTETATVEDSAPLTVTESVDLSDSPSESSSDSEEGAHGEGESLTTTTKATCPRNYGGCGAPIDLHNDRSKSWGTCEKCGISWRFTNTGSWERVE